MTGYVVWMRSGEASARPTDGGAYICPACGEEIVIPLDISAGSEQECVEDCPVCCHPKLVHVEFF